MCKVSTLYSSFRELDWQMRKQYVQHTIDSSIISKSYSLLQNLDSRPYSKSSHTLNEWRFNLSFSWVLMLFLNSWRVSVVPYSATTHPPAIQKQHWHSREAQIEQPLIECEWAFRIRASGSDTRGASGRATAPPPLIISWTPLNYGRKTV
jgi:hypothetical protein